MITELWSLFDQNSVIITGGSVRPRDRRVKVGEEARRLDVCAPSPT